MKAALHAVGRSAEIHPLLALGAELHEVESIEQARAVARELDRENVLLLLSEEFADAETESSAALVLVLPGIQAAAEGGLGPKRDPLEMTRELVSRSVGVDLIAKSKRMVRRDG
jgi:hypothetical protein